MAGKTIILDGAIFKADKVTKNTVRYQEQGDVQIVGAVYVQKHALTNPAPKAVKVTIEVEE